jgi:hypothetical protein
MSSAPAVSVAWSAAPTGLDGLNAMREIGRQFIRDHILTSDPATDDPRRARIRALYNRTSQQSKSPAFAG